MPPAIIGGALVAGGSLASGLIGSSAAKSAANQESNAANQATQLQRDIFNQTQQDLSPYIQAGTTAQNALLNGLGLGPQSNADVWNQYLQDNPDVAAAWKAQSPAALADYAAKGITTPQQFAQYHYETYGQYEPGRTLPSGITNATNPLTSPLLATFAPTESQLQQTPGYQFNLSQGLKAVQNAASARGLGVSGAAWKGALNYATGLDDQTFQTQANNYYTGQQNQYNRLMGLTGSGESAAAGQGQLGAQTGANIGNTMVGAGQAQAAGTVGSANALTGALGNLSNLYLTNQLLGGGLFGGGGGNAAASIYGNSVGTNNVGV